MPEPNAAPTAATLETFHWRNQLRYRCPRSWEDGTPCSFDHYDPDVVLRHSREPHSRQPPANVVNTNPGDVEHPSPYPPDAQYRPDADLEKASFAEPRE